MSVRRVGDHRGHSDSLGYNVPVWGAQASKLVLPVSGEAKKQRCHPRSELCR